MRCNPKTRPVFTYTKCKSFSHRAPDATPTHQPSCKIHDYIKRAPSTLLTGVPEMSIYRYRQPTHGLPKQEVTVRGKTHLTLRVQTQVTRTFGLHLRYDSATINTFASKSLNGKGVDIAVQETRCTCFMSLALDAAVIDGYLSNCLIETAG